MSQEPICADDLTFEDGVLFHDRKGRPVALPEAPAPIADSHGHLTCFRGHDPAVAICRAALAGVRLLVVPVDPVDEIPRKFPTPEALLEWLDATVERARGLLERCAERGMVPPEAPGQDPAPLTQMVRLVAGVHPYGAPRLDDDALARLDVLLDSPRCVGVGEIGLDVGPYSELPLEAQEAAFRTQLRVARERDLPVELHIRDDPDDPRPAAHELAARVLLEEGVPERGCDLHCFTQGPEVMEPFVELGCRVAFGGAMTFNRSEDVRRAAAACPTPLLLSETDSPYMAPVPLRGEECEPAMVARTKARRAEVREGAGHPRQETYEACWRNALGLFSLA